jgi:polyisoprenoid-binding protein YceI
MLMACKGSKRIKITLSKELTVLRIVDYRLGLSLLTALAWHNAAAREYYAIDPVHTRVAFQVMHAGFSPSIGTVSKPTGHIWFDEKNPANSSVEISIPVATLDLGDEAWNQKVAESFLLTEKHPTARFISTSVRVMSENPLQLDVDGQLHMAGGSIPVSFKTQLNAHKRHPLTFKQTLGLQASTQFSRKAMGIDAWSSVVGDTVTLQVAVEAIRTDPEAEKEKENP